MFLHSVLAAFPLRFLRGGRIGLDKHSTSFSSFSGNIDSRLASTAGAMLEIN